MLRIQLRIHKPSRTAGLIKGLLLVLATGLGGSLAFAAVQDQIRERIQPAGEVCVMGTECAAGLGAVAAGAGGARDVATIYQNFCFACHGTGVNNAPVKDNAEHWNPRLERGIPALYESAVNGFNNGLMPVKGLCMDCSNEELHATVDYMLEGLQ